MATMAGIEANKRIKAIHAPLQKFAAEATKMESGAKMMDKGKLK